MVDQWQQHDGSRHHLSITRGEFTAFLSVVHGIGGTQHYWTIEGPTGRTAACGTAGSIDAAKRAAEAALKELAE